MDNKPTVSIGIPAFNEEANILNLIFRLLHQKSKSYTLKEIIVVSDQSTDKTDKLVQFVNDEHIKLLRNTKRLGQALSQNKILEKFSGDYLILLNADVLPDDTFIENILKPFKNKKVGLVGAHLIPLPGKTLFERVINYSVEMKQQMYEEWNKGNNLYMCHGRARAFSRSFAKKFKWPAIVQEDSFSYLSCLENKFSFVYQPNATIYYKSPSTFKDHRQQSSRFLRAENDLKKYFSLPFIKKELAIPSSIMLKTFKDYFLKNPLFFILYASILVAVKLFPYQMHTNNYMWPAAKSSKKLTLELLSTIL